MKLALNDKRAIVCGSSQGIGRACAHALSALGATITLIARDEASLDLVRRELSTSANQEHDYLVADFSRPEELRQRLESQSTHGRIVHILVNNTGGPPSGPLYEAEIETFETAFAMHLICNHILTRAVLPGMRSAGYGRIINIISTSVKQPLKGLGVSNTIRGAVASWAKTLANELGQSGITVNNVLPGATRTGRLQSLFQQRAQQTGKSVAEIEQEFRAPIPIGRFAEPDEIANAVAFLASPAASAINGINLPVDGGRTGCL